ncbi:hypothetical protein OIU85_012656 [Salix viminalis]|uniref:Uncharacterized protein n=1 Tax=Salix viminalis TaxID=40686 RepID=A0A9Q0SDF8_SALVM|nr:hypothetical protein OIU85_012656 [Salix viminalis]
MLLGNSLGTTKKFFQKTVQRFKSFFSGDPYQKIPKPPARSDPRTSSFAAGIGMKAETNKDKEKSERDKKKTATAPSSSSAKQERDHDLNSGFMNLSKATAVKNYQFSRRREQDYRYDDPNNEMIKRSYARKRSPLDDSSGSKNITAEGRSFLVAQKLKGARDDGSYRDIVDKFFMDMYAEFIAPPANPRSVNSRPRLRTVR